MWTTGLAQTERGPVPYLEHGEGDLLVAWHGFPDLPATFGPLAEHLAGLGWRVVAPYLRGYHPDAMPSEPHFDAATLTLDALALLDALSPREPVALLGHDWGATPVYGLAAAFRERVRAGVVMTVPPPAAFMRVLADPEQLRRSFYIWLFQLPHVAEHIVGRTGLVNFLWRTWSPGLDEPAHLQSVRELLGRPAHLDAALGYYRAIFDDAHRDPELSELRHRIAGAPASPLLLLGGQDDGCMGAEFLADAGATMPEGCRTELRPGVGHFLHLEDPEGVARRVDRWLREAD
jgi:pimeloyl-ACP methyl ester carboxylesterase